jgi:hypothetical protein
MEETMIRPRKLPCVRVLVSLFLLIYFGLLVDAQENFAVKIPDGSPAAICATSDGGYLLVFRLPHSGVYARLLVRKVNSSGKKVWETGLRQKQAEEFTSANVVELLDGSYMLTANKYDGNIFEERGQETYFVKLTRNGAIESQKGFGGERSAVNLGSLALSPDGSFLAAGQTNTGFGNFGSYGATIAAFDAAGTVRWSKTYRGNFSFYYYAPQGWVRTPANEYIFAASILSDGGPHGSIVFKIDSNGNLLWSKHVQAAASLDFFSAAATSDRGCVLLFDHFLNSTRSSTNYVVRLNADGGLLWTKRFRGASSSFTRRALTITQSRSGGFALAGLSDQGFTAKLTAQGVVSSCSTLSLSLNGPGFILPRSSSGYVLFSGGDAGNLLFGLGTNAGFTGCSMFRPATLESLTPKVVTLPRFAVTSVGLGLASVATHFQTFVPSTKSDVTICP